MNSFLPLQAQQCSIYNKMCLHLCISFTSPQKSHNICFHLHGIPTKSATSLLSPSLCSFLPSILPPTYVKDLVNSNSMMIPFNTVHSLAIGLEYPHVWSVTFFLQQTINVSQMVLLMWPITRTGLNGNICASASVTVNFNHSDTTTPCILSSSRAGNNLIF